MSSKLIIKDAFWQILGRLLSAIWWFIVLKLITPYLWPLRFWDYNTILKYFAIWSAFADFWLYVFALKTLWEIKNKHEKHLECFDPQIYATENELPVAECINLTQEEISQRNKDELSDYYSKFVTARLLNIAIVYILALIIAFFIPSYTSNPYIIRGLPFWMLFSASFMFAGIIQLPLQLFWKMKHLSISLVISRIVQIIILFFSIYFAFKWVNFDWNTKSIISFQVILFSVFISWFAQFLYVYLVWRKYIDFKLKLDWNYEKYLLKTNWQYWLAYYISSFHTLIVTILLSIFFPTIEWFKYAWIWALALSLIEILLIVPSALGNSSIHRITAYEDKKKMESFWNLMLFILWIWIVFLINFTIFSKDIIYFIWWEKFLSNWQVWSDFILPFLAIVLLLSFIKQTFNYIFVAKGIQNKLLAINWTWVLIWTLIWIPMILKFNIIWWIFTQTLLEILYAWWALFVAAKNNSFPKINWKYFLYFCTITTIFIVWWKYIINLDTNSLIKFIAYWIIINIIIVWLSYKPIKHLIKNI